ncbi:tryptophanyl-tRNA synthetase [Roseibium hamelinense]|uniref:Tryptophan--tRNA ligase n=2 Tax=Roseibium hamelinense TaxID=150831 RepID=A0A562SNL0_9HYPH|nr:tryptophanyl-tRNA synthetase [Roseibium hamelinense]
MHSRLGLPITGATNNPWGPVQPALRIKGNLMSAFHNRVFSGVQPTGNLHLGNYLGAVSRWVPLQDQMETIFCVVDLHAITAGFSAAGELASATREVTAAYIAAGIDPKKSIIFNQSQVREHAELAWIFNCVARMGWLNRMTQFKEKAGKNKENASVGLFAYPNLMAADILAYRATHVPVGDDQKQHLELTRDIAAKFNNDFADRITELGIGVPNPTPSPELPENLYFPLTEPMIAGPATRIMSLRDGTKKMSKSDPSDLSRINLTDDADAISKKIKKAKTDPDALPTETGGLEGRPEADNLVGIYAALTGVSKQDVLKEYGGQQFSAFKPALSDLAVEKLSPMTDEMRRLTDDPTEIDAVLKSGSERASEIAEPVLKDVRQIIGFLDVH